MRRLTNPANFNLDASLNCRLCTQQSIHQIARQSWHRCSSGTAAYHRRMNSLHYYISGMLSRATEESSIDPNLAPQAVARQCPRTELCSGPRVGRGIAASSSVSSEFGGSGRDTASPCTSSRGISGATGAQNESCTGQLHAPSAL
jgi:hypothetical protein